MATLPNEHSTAPSSLLNATESSRTTLALARTWRPHHFEDVIGQDPIIQALQHSFQTNHFHHAYLFSGTRGVGKTTLARLVARALNCEIGISAQPCGKCSACNAIQQGRFIDVLEIDAASRTGVDDIRELLEQTQYVPSVGRYKVFLIDEVHMLSNHSFNALLKTLEEPPAHVQFLFATTDPQKLPVTVVSRCVHFHLRPLSAELITQQLIKVTHAEQVFAEQEALEDIALLASGSVRDALTLLDQAIAQGKNQVSVAVVRSMLGLVDSVLISNIVEGLATTDISRVISSMHEITHSGADIDRAMATLLQWFHNIAMIQILGEQNIFKQYTSLEYKKWLKFAQSFSVAEVQLMYQALLQGRRDLALAASPVQGFEMALLRMIACVPNHLSEKSIAENTQSESVQDDKKKIKDFVELSVELPEITSSENQAFLNDSGYVASNNIPVEILTKSSNAVEFSKEEIITQSSIATDSAEYVEWAECILNSALKGVARAVMMDSDAIKQPQGWLVKIPEECANILSDAVKIRIVETLKDQQQDFKIQWQIGQINTHSTPRSIETKRLKQKELQAKQEFEQTPWGRFLIQELAVDWVNIVAQ
ncbi:MAG: DNA polymerase III subunit gamma/tau [Pseudomonadota bacterium]